MPEQLPLAVELREPVELDHFVAGANQELLTAVTGCAQGDIPRRLLLHGPPHSGRTHLLLAATRAARRAGREALYVSLAGADTPDLLEALDRCEMLCIDDLDMPLVERAWSVAIARLVDAIDANDGGLLIATRNPPDRMPFAMPDLRTRLSRCVVFGIKPLDDAGLRALLRRRAHLRGMNLSEEVAEYLVRRLPRDPTHLIEVLDHLDRATLKAQRRLTLPFVQSQLAALAPPSAQTSAS
jgi:DnaA family protein